VTARGARRPASAGPRQARARARVRRGRFVVLEGLDGAGTTTQARLLAERIRLSGRRVHLTAEPSGGPVGSLVRQVLTGRIRGAGDAPFDPAALALLFAADRKDHYATEIGPKLAEGLDVVCDRFTLSSLAYQGAHLGDMRWVEALNREAAPSDAVVFLRCRPEVALRRRFAASVDREIFEVDAFQRRVAARYEEAIRRMRRAGERIVELDGEAPVHEVAAAVWGAVRRLG
jgi:dTMP kinase